MRAKRFIAGVVCPSCGAMDSIYMFRDGAKRDYRECIECGFSDAMEVNLTLKGDLPKARIAREEIVLEEYTDVIRFVDVPIQDNTEM